MSALETIVLTQSNIKTVCRICLEKKPHLFSFRDAVAIEGEKFNPTIISDMLVKLTVGQIRQERGLPKKICTKCVSLLQAAYVFHLKLQESTKLLKFFMVTTFDARCQVPSQNVSKPVSIKQNAPAEIVTKATNLSQNALPQSLLAEVEPVGGKESQLKEVRNPDILPKINLTKTEALLEKNSVGKPNNDQPIQLLFPTNVSFKIEPLAGNQMLSKEMKILNIPPQKVSKRTQPTLEIKTQDTAVVNQSVGTANNLRKLQVLSPSILNKKVTKKNMFSQIDSKNSEPILENQTIGMENNLQKVHTQNISSSAEPVLQTLIVGDGVQEQNIPQQTILNHAEVVVDQEVGDAPVCESEIEGCNIPEKGEKVDVKSVAPPRAPLYTCPICEEELKTPIELKQHVHKHKGLKKYLNIPSLQKNVKFCAKPRGTVSLFSRPVILHKCPHCNKEISGRSISNHLNNHLEQGRFKCNQCDRVFRRLNNLGVHRIQHLKEHPYWCNDCEKGFMIKSNYDCHMLTHTVSVTQFPHECRYCSKRFANPRHLHRHKVIHTDKVTYNRKYRVIRCKKCLECFKTEAQLSNHTCTPTEITLTTRFPCKFCKKVFKRAGGLYCHLNYIHKQKKRLLGLCQICGRFVKCMSTHMKIHTKPEKTHQCVLCGTKFITMSRLKQHILIHTGEKRYNCSECEKRFPTKQRLDRHFMRIHSNLRPYVCNICEKTFNDPNNLRVHERIHLGIKNHICPICDKGFSEKAYLKRHYVNVHKVINFT